MDFLTAGMLFLFAPLAGLPLGVPPLPPDPVMERVAPEQCLYYFSWSGMAAPQGDSGNATERLLAEPEIQQMMKRIEVLLRKAATENAPSAKETQWMARVVPDLAKTAITRHTTVFLESIDIQKKNLVGGAIVNLGEQADAVKRDLLRLQSMAAGGRPPKAVAGWYQLPIPNGNVCTWNVRGKYLVVGLGADAEVSNRIVKRARGNSVPAWLSAAKKDLAVKRVSMTGYVNVKKAMEIAAPLLKEQGAQAVIDALGLTNVSSLASISGLDDKAFVTRSLISIEGPAAGVLALADAKPLTAADLKDVPRDATFAAAARVDLTQVYKLAMGILGKVEPGEPDQIQKNLARMEKQLGIDFQKDVLQGVGDGWRIYSSPGEGGLIPLGLTAVADVRNPEGVAKALGVFESMLEQQFKRERNRPQFRRPRSGATRPSRIKFEEVKEKIEPPAVECQVEDLDEAASQDDTDFADEHHGTRRPARGMTIKSVKFRGQKISFVQSIGEQMPFAPAWCLTKDKLIVSLYPQGVKAFLSRTGDEPTLAQVPDVAAAFAGDKGPIAIGYADMKSIAKIAYPLIQVGAQFAVAEMQKNGIDVDMSLLPSAASILPHLSSRVARIHRTKQGIRVDSHQVLPGGGGVGASPLLAAALLPAVASARNAARIAQSTNNLRQIGIAMLHYESDHNKLPTDIYDDKGKALLSWRVRLLRYTEHEHLYRQFKLDEPWDSDHNKKLLSKMPPIFNSPTGPHKFKTRYLVPRGEDTIFPGKKALTLASIRDGTSNTIAMMEVNQSAAVEWTRPADWKFDSSRPHRELFGPSGRGETLVMWADISVRRLPGRIGADDLASLFMRNDGKRVDIYRIIRGAEGGRGIEDSDATESNVPAPLEP